MVESVAVSNPVVVAASKLLADQRIRFLIVGGINTALGFGSFALFELAIGRYLGRFGYMVSLLMSYAFAMSIAFVLHRRFVFKVRGNLWVDLGRFIVTNLVGLGLNAVLLPALITVTGWDPIIAQGLTVFIVALASYLLHKHFSFRRSNTEPDSVAGQAEAH